ncbi:hypothetical protein BC831DRAFT_494864, partial [Entophlyctis helioformis]
MSRPLRMSSVRRSAVHRRTQLNTTRQPLSMTKTSSSRLVLTMCLASTMTSSRVTCQTAPLALPFSCCAVWLKQQPL